MKTYNISEKLEELNLTLKRSFYDDRNKYLFSNGYFSPVEIPQSNWSDDGFVFCDEFDNIIGCIIFSISRPTNIINIYNLITFTNEFKYRRYIYNEIIKYIENILNNSYHTKITFSVVIGNPIEKAYDKIIRRYIGRVVGISEKECLLKDGKYYDLKRYEIINRNFKF